MRVIVEASGDPADCGIGWVLDGEGRRVEPVSDLAALLALFDRGPFNRAFGAFDGGQLFLILADVEGPPDSPPA